MLTVNTFTKVFDGPAFQSCLNNLYEALGNKDPDEWAKELYLRLRHDPANTVSSSLNQDRKTCLKLIYDLVNAMEESPDPQVFAAEVLHEFQVWRIKKILKVCLVMDKYQSLIKLQIPTSPYAGMHWYSSLHLDPYTPYAQMYPEEQQSFKFMLNSTHYQGSGTMNKRLLKLIYCNASFGLLNDPYLSTWCRPASASFALLPTSVPTADDVVSAPQTDSSLSCEFVGGMVHSPALITDKIRRIIQGFVDSFDQDEFQICLARLYHDLRSQEPEVWARKLYLKLRDDPFDPRASTLNQDRKTCLSLLYRLVNEWEAGGFSKEFECGIRQIFKVRRILRILGVCLIMDRCQSLYKMQILGNGSVGMHWFCELHFNEATAADSAHHLTTDELLMWKTLLSNYSGKGTMNKRLYRLLYSKELGLQENELLSRWSKPCPALVEPKTTSPGCHHY